MFEIAFTIKGCNLKTLFVLCEQSNGEGCADSYIDRSAPWSEVDIDAWRPIGVYKTAHFSLQYRMRRSRCEQRLLSSRSIVLHRHDF
jgi:hypothetical protein